MLFSKWLDQQIGRDDPVGDLARDARADKRGLPETRSGWYKHLADANACRGAIDAMREAWDEYEATGLAQPTGLITFTDLMATPEDLQISEDSYRRGVHQALAVLAQHIADKKLNPLDALHVAADIASEYRASPKPHGALLHDLTGELDKRLTAKRRRSKG